MIPPGHLETIMEDTVEGSSESQHSRSEYKPEKLRLESNERQLELVLHDDVALELEVAEE